MSDEKLTADEWATLNAEKQSQANQKVMEEVLEKMLPKHDLEAEVKHWHKSFISSAMCSGKGVAESIQDADDAISCIYGALGFKLVTQK